MLLAVAVMVLGVSAAQANPITYNILDYPLQEALTCIGPTACGLSGSITTNGTLGSELTEAIVTSWTLSITGPLSWSASSSDVDAHLFLVGDVTATASQLLISDQGSYGYGYLYVWAGPAPFGNRAFVEQVGSPTETAARLGDTHSWWTSSNNDLLFGSDPAVIATAVPTITAIPEPTSMLLFGTGLLGLAARLRRRLI